MSNVTNGSPVADNTLAGIIKFNDKNLSEIDVSDLVQPSELMAELPVYTASNGILHKFAVETGAAGAAFRTVNNGVSNTAGTEKLVTVELKFLDCSWTRDVAIGQGFSKGKDVYYSKQAMKSFNAGVSKGETCLVQGTAYDADGPDGLDDLIQDEMKINAGGSTAGTHVYMGIKGEDAVAVIVGNDGQFDMGEVIQVPIADETGKLYNVDSQNITGYMGLQVAGKYSAAMAYNVTSVDDDLLSDLFAKFPSDRRNALKANGFILMSVNAQKLLQKSRTATSATGAPAPWPVDWNGIKIVVSGAVKDDYAVVTTTTPATTTAE